MEQRSVRFLGVLALLNLPSFACQRATVRVPVDGAGTLLHAVPAPPSASSSLAAAPSVLPPAASNWQPVTPTAAVRPPFSSRTIGGINFEVRSKSPSPVVVDGKLDEWAPRADAGGLPRVVVTIEPSRFWLAFEMDAKASSPLAFQLSLPGGELPNWGVLASGGVDEFDCERISAPVESESRTSECRRRLTIAKRYTELLSSHVPRFKTWIELDGERLLWSRDNTAKFSPTTTQRACIRDEKRLSCEFELPLSLLPRTATVELTEVGFLTRDVANAPREEVWVSLPEPIVFESGLWIHQNAMFPATTDFVPRFSYQPGAGDEYEIASRDDWETNGVSNVSISSCRPGPVLATLGSVTLLGNCAPARMTFIYRNGEPIGTAIDGKVFVRDSTMVVLSKREYFNFQYLSPVASFTVELIDSEGTKREPLELNTEGMNCEASKALANADYSKLSLTCTTSTDGKVKRVTRRAWRWDRKERTYVEQE